MLWFKNKEVKTESMVDKLQAQEKKARDERAKQVGDLLINCLNATPAVDFAIMRVVSIERILKEEVVEGMTLQIPCTVIGYIGDNVLENSVVTKAVLEWYIRCNDKQHELLVKDFKDFIAKRKQYFDGGSY